VLSQDELQNFLLQQMGRGIRSSGGFFAPSERPLATFRYRDIPRPDRDRIEAAFAIAYERAVAAGSTRSESYNPSLEENIVRQYIAEQRGEEIVRAP
jgi:Tfp pilus assembly protein PilW